MSDKNAITDNSGPLPLEKLIETIDKESGLFENKQNKLLNKSNKFDKSNQSYEAYKKSQYIRFALDNILLAIPLSKTLEIGHVPPITFLPNLPNWILGISNLRGQIISVIDIKMFFGMTVQVLQRFESKRFIVVYDKDLKIGFVVDNIYGILSLDKENIKTQQSPYSKNKELNSYITEVILFESNLINVLDVDKLINSPQMINYNF